MFRDGRKILIKILNTKKHNIQKTITKKTQNFLKKNWLNTNKYCLNNLIRDCNIFYLLYDVNYFIQNFGILINSKINHNHKYLVNKNITFRIMLSAVFIKYLIKQKKNIKLIFKKIKLYKYRIKNKLFKVLNKWLNFQEFTLNCLFLSHFNQNILEFSLKSFSGVLFYNNLINCVYYQYLHTDLTLFMNRSYNWKYLT